MWKHETWIFSSCIEKDGSSGKTHNSVMKSCGNFEVALKIGREDI